MATPETQPTTRHWHRWVIVAVLLALVVVGLITYSYQKSNERAEAKATELTAGLEKLGLPAPANTDTIVRVLGDDGGVVCDDPGGALRTALVNAALVNGAAFVGQRPIRAAPRRLIAAQFLVVKIYCPDQLEALQDRLGDYRVDDVKKH